MNLFYVRAMQRCACFALALFLLLRLADMWASPTVLMIFSQHFGVRHAVHRVIEVIPTVLMIFKSALRGRLG